MISKDHKVLIIGLGIFERELLKRISDTWETFVLDTDAKHLKKYRQEIRQAKFFTGDASSILTWKKLNLQGLRFVISTVKDIDVNLEICRFIRKMYGPDISIIILAYAKVNESLFKKYRVTVINPMEMGIQSIIKIMEKNYIHATNIGLGQGELVGVNILARSRLVDRKLKHLKPYNWHVSALYRNGRLIVPDGNTTLQVGDQVVLVGNPKILENVANVLIKGTPQFPLQFGTDLVFPFHEHFSDHLDELIEWHSAFKAKKTFVIPLQGHLPESAAERIKKKIKPCEIGEMVEIFRDIFKMEINASILFVPMRKTRLDRLHIRLAFKHSRKPFLISRLTFPYQAVAVSLNGPDPGLALETGYEISQLLQSPLQVMLITLPKEVRGYGEDENLEYCRSLVKDFEDIYKIRISFKILEGNPVTKTLQYLASSREQLLVITCDPADSLSIFKPNISYMIARKISLSTLVIPISNE